MDTRLGVGFVPGLFVEMAAYPAVLETVWDLIEADVDLDGISPQARRLIAGLFDRRGNGHTHVPEPLAALVASGLDDACAERLLEFRELCLSFLADLESGLEAEELTPDP